MIAGLSGGVSDLGVSLVTLSVTSVVSLVMWIVLLMFSIANLIWISEIVLLPLRNSDTEDLGKQHGPDDIQIRVLTIDAEEVVQRSVDALPAEFGDRHVIAETAIDIEGAAVHTVPESFSCNATNKGRALEWARRNVPCEKEYVLYIDEDSIASELETIPDVDIVQFSECPTRTGSLFTYLAELFRMGFQIEQRAFSSLSIPLYAWGGGLAIRKDLEDQITWNYDTIIEDTTFTWKAASETSLDFMTVSTKFYNQSPPTTPDMIQQRRRWIAGAVNDLDVLPLFYRTVFIMRTIAWVLTPVSPFLLLLSATQDALLFNRYYMILAFILTVLFVAWAIIGVWYVGESFSTAVSLLLLIAPVSFLHSLGAFAGFLFPTSDFQTTRKISPLDEMKEVNTAYEEQDD